MPENQPTLVKAGPLVLTGVGSSAVGDQAGNALAEIINWMVGFTCNCIPPDAVLSAVHTLCVLAFVAGAMLIHVKNAKVTPEDN